MKKRWISVPVLVISLGAPVWGSAQTMGHTMPMTETEHLQHEQMRGVTEAMSQMAGQMRSALTRMTEMAEGPATHLGTAMHQDMEELHRHMQQMTEGMEASLEVLLRMERGMEGGVGEPVEGPGPEGPPDGVEGRNPGMDGHS